MPCRVIETAVARALGAKQNAATSDVDEVHVVLKEQDHKFATLEARVAALEKKPPPPRSRPSTGSSSSASASTTACEDGWQPRFIRITGWAPWACEADKKLKREEAQVVARRIVALCDGDLARALCALPPSALNHSISYKAVEGSGVRARADELQAWLGRKAFPVRPAHKASLAKAAA